MMAEEKQKNHDKVVNDEKDQRDEKDTKDIGTEMEKTFDKMMEFAKKLHEKYWNLEDFIKKVSLTNLNLSKVIGVYCMIAHNSISLNRYSLLDFAIKTENKQLLDILTYGASHPTSSFYINFTDDEVYIFREGKKFDYSNFETQVVKKLIITRKVNLLNYFCHNFCNLHMDYSESEIDTLQNNIIDLFVKNIEKYALYLASDYEKFRKEIDGICYEILCEKDENSLHQSSAVFSCITKTPNYAFYIENILSDEKVCKLVFNYMMFWENCRLSLKKFLTELISEKNDVKLAVKILQKVQNSNHPFLRLSSFLEISCLTKVETVEEILKIDKEIIQNNAQILINYVDQAILHGRNDIIGVLRI